MSEVVKDKRIILFYIISMLMTYLLVVSVEVLNNNITEENFRIVYNG